MIQYDTELLYDTEDNICQRKCKIFIIVMLTAAVKDT